MNHTCFYLADLIWTSPSPHSPEHSTTREGGRDFRQLLSEQVQPLDPESSSATYQQCQLPHLSQRGQRHLPCRAADQDRERPAQGTWTTPTLQLTLLPQPKTPHSLVTEPGWGARPPTVSAPPITYSSSATCTPFTSVLHFSRTNRAGQNKTVIPRKSTVNQSRPRDWLSTSYSSPDLPKHKAPGHV